jgi:hypothetical protein
MPATLADIFRLHGPAFLERSGNAVLPGHAKALRDITRCRTPALGGQTFQCRDCGKTQYSYHSCNNRHCPACQNNDTTAWVEKQRDTLLPVPYFFATFTVPEELGSEAYAHQRIFYNALFRAASRALLECSGRPRFVGGEIGFMAVLHTWTRDLRYHPHVHCVIPGGGIIRANGKDGAPPSSWVSAKSPDFFVPVKPLSRLFKAKMRHELSRSGFFGKIPSSVWSKEWVVHIQPAGTGREVVQYLAPYVFRTALSNKRIVALRDGLVTFKFKKRGSKRWSYQTLEAVAFIKRFMRHVLPKGLVKVRYYGFMAPNKRKDVAAVRAELEKMGDDGKETTIHQESEEKNGGNAENEPSGGPGKKRMACSRCGGELIWVRDLPRVRAPP